MSPFTEGMECQVSLTPKFDFQNAVMQFDLSLSNLICP